jgi:hypothetical protein
VGDGFGGQVLVGGQVGTKAGVYVGRGVRVGCSGYEVAHVGSGGQVAHPGVDVGVGVGVSSVYGNAPRSTPFVPVPLAGLSAVRW